MSSGSVAAFDTSFLNRLSHIDSDCGLIDLFICLFETDQGVTDHFQLGNMDACNNIHEKLEHHGFTHGQILDFVYNAPESQANRIEKIYEDPADLGLFLAIRYNSGSVLLTCDRQLLYLAAGMYEAHYCFKASVRELEDNLGGVISGFEYETNEMFTGSGNPFFYFGEDRYCPLCDPATSCRSRRDLS